MHRHQRHNQILYDDIERLKSSYKLEQPQSMPWLSMGLEVKIQMRKTEPSQIHESSEEQEVTCNAFSKTKHLFKKKQPSSIITDDLTDQHIFVLSPKQEGDKTLDIVANKIQFDSFGGQDPIRPISKVNGCPLGGRDGNEDLKNWNSESFEINFGKSVKGELNLPESKQNILNEKLVLQRTDTMENSIKQFCFRLSEDNGHCLESTPIGKWTNSKQSYHKQRMLTEPSHHGQEHRSMLKQAVKDCMNTIQNINSSNLTAQIARDAKGLLENVNCKLKGVKRRLIFGEKDSQSTKGKEDSSETMRLQEYRFEQVVDKTKRRIKDDSSSFQKQQSKSKISECRQRDQGKAEIFPDRKVQIKQQRFRC